MTKNFAGGLTNSGLSGIVIRHADVACLIYRGIAQLVEQRSPKPRAEGSNPSAPAKIAGSARDRRFFFADTTKREQAAACSRLYYLVYRIGMPAFRQAARVAASHTLDCTSPMWAQPSSSMHSRL